MTNNPRDIIDQLSGDQARLVLKALAKENVDLAIRVREMAFSCLARVDAAEIGETVYAGLEAVDVAGVRDRGGSAGEGYVELREVASALVGTVLSHFFSELQKYQQLGMRKQAKQVAMGLLLGLHAFEHRANTEFKEWVADAPRAWAGEVLRAWTQGQPDRADLQEMEAFVAARMPDWLDVLPEAQAATGQEP